MNSNSIDKMEHLLREVISLIPNINPFDENLIDTPQRIAKMYHDMFWGLDPANEPKLTAFPTDGYTTGMVGTGKIFFSSICAHHFLPFTGHAHIFYIPRDTVMGLSKFTRILGYFAARPQIQERLAAQVADYIMEKINPYGCYVVLKATHSCMQCRGVRQERSAMVTPVIRPISSEGVPEGPFADTAVREEALKLMEGTTS
jgi:GTP cyclohydrolase I